MFRDMDSDGLCSKESPSSAVASGLGVGSLKHGTQESSWFGMLSVVSRPALTFLQKYLPGRSRTPTSFGGERGWVNDDVTRTLDGGKNAFLERFNDFLPATELQPHLAYLQYQHGPTGFGSSSAGTLSCLSAESLCELGIHNAADKDVSIRRPITPVGYCATARRFLSHVLVNTVSIQREARSAEQVLSSGSWSADSLTEQATSSWWSGFWGSDNSQGWLSNLSWGAGLGKASQHCCENDSGSQQVEFSTVAGVAKPTELFILCEETDSKHSESAGPCHKGKPDNGSSCSVRPETLSSLGKPLLDYQPACVHLVGTRTAAACSEVAVLTPDQDNGYSSLEEEQSNSRLHMMNRLCHGQGCPEACERAKGQDVKAVPEVPELEVASVGRGKEDCAESRDGEASGPEDLEPSRLSAPRCQNKAITFIMGGPCSEDSESESEGDCDWDSEDDDGFDSEGVSDFSDSEDLDDDDSEDNEKKESDTGEATAEVERLWNSLCQNGDPYNPRNFTAALRTAPPARAAAEEVACVALVGDEEPDNPRGPSSPGPEESSGEEASDLDEAESLRLWNSFACVSDPYSPLNFQATLRTRSPDRGFCRLSPFTLSCYTKEEVEERLDSGFSEDLSIPDQHCAKLKKVRFVEEVEEFYASSDEDRRGPWEEFARDRCRFLRRVQETEDAIGYCLAPTYRLFVFKRLYPNC